MSGNKTAKSVLITGGADRIGRALALGFADAGWSVAIHYNESSAKAAETAQLCRRGGAAKTALFQADFLGDGAVGAADTVIADKLVERVVGEFGPLGCLINNASIYEPKSLAATDDALWQRQHGINFKLPFFLAKKFAAMLPKGSCGVIINMLDQRVLNPTPCFPAYSLAKSGLFAATRILALRLAPRVRVNAVAPGHVLRNAHQSESEFTRLCEQVPLRRASTVEDVAEAVKFLAFAESVTGQTIAVDGGQSMGWRQPFDNDKV